MTITIITDDKLKRKCNTIKLNENSALTINGGETTGKIVSDVAPMTEKEINGSFFVLSANQNKYNIELFPTADIKKDTPQATDNETGKEEKVLLFEGTQTLNPGKAFLMGEVENGNKIPVKMSIEDGTIIARLSDGRKCGSLASGQEFPEEFTSLPMVSGKARKCGKKNKFEVVLSNGSSETSNYASNFEDEIRRLSEGCLDHPENVRRKIQFMNKAGFPEELVSDILKSYTYYNGPDRQRIQNPEFPFMDSDSYLVRCVAYAMAGLNIRLVGDKGAGKNTLLSTISWLLNMPLFKIGCSERTDEYTVFGSTQIKDGDTMFKLSPFAHGLTIGAICVLDEGNTVPPELMITINQLADSSREVDITGYGKLSVHKKSIIALTMNENYEGTVSMNEATVDRFQGVYLKSGMSLSALLRFLVPDADAHEIEVCQKVSDGILKSIKDPESELTPESVTIRGYQAALMASKWIPFNQRLIDSVCGRIQDEDSRNTVKSIISAYV